jgi:hypothetical protein
MQQHFDAVVWERSNGGELVEGKLPSKGNRACVKHPQAVVAVVPTANTGRRKGAAAFFSAAPVDKEMTARVAAEQGRTASRRAREKDLEAKKAETVFFAFQLDTSELAALHVVHQGASSAAAAANAAATANAAALRVARQQEKCELHGRIKALKKQIADKEAAKRKAS